MPINSPTLLPRKILNPEGSHSAFVMSNANKAIDWLREAAENKRRTNDDKILSACINLCRRFSKTTGVIRTSKEEAVLQRTVVLLTEDRGLSAKALASRVPVRTFPNFLKWAFPDAEKSTKNT
uniref:PINc domain-containing protein n=1 Tax=Meloidogyne hapla TaxID=6305 RepID=A0A1I8BPX8_MELHA